MVVRLEVVKRVLMTGVLAVTILHSVMAIVWGMVAMAAIELVLNLVATTRLCTLSLGGSCGRCCPSRPLRR